MGLEGSDADTGQGHLPVGGPRLGRHRLQLGVDPLEALADLEDPAVEVDGVPGQPQQLRAAQTGVEREDVQHLESVTLGVVEQVPAPPDAQAPVDLVARAREAVLRLDEVASVIVRSVP